MFFKVKNYHLIFIFSILTGLFLRFFRIGEIMEFIGDFGFYYLQARDFILGKEIPLVGIPSSVPILRQGAIWSWMLGVFLYLGNFHPVWGAYLSSLLGILGIFILFSVLKIWFNQKIAAIAAMIAATSPFIVFLDRQPFITSGIFPLTALIFFVLTKVFEKKEKCWFFLGFLLSIVYQFELASFLLIPIVFLALYIFKVNMNLKNISSFIFGGILGLLPFIIWDIREKTFLQTIGFIFWLFSKILENISSLFKGLISLSVFTPFISFIQELTLPMFPRASLIVFFFGLVILIYETFKKHSDVNRFILVWFLFSILGFFIRGIFSGAYFPIIFLPSILILSVFLEKIINKIKIVGLIFFAFLIFSNFTFTLLKISKEENYPSLSERIKVADFIIKDSKGGEFSLVYLGPSYQFESGDNHWRYLLWWRGGNPKPNQKRVYAIFEPPFEFASNFSNIYNFKNIKLGVKSND